MYLSAPAGSGKTQSIVEFSIRNANDGRKTLIVQPTKLLVDSTAERIRRASQSVRVRSIHTGTVCGATEEISKHIGRADTDAEVLLICQKGFDQLQEMPRLNEWDANFRRGA